MDSEMGPANVNVLPFGGLIALLLAIGIGIILFLFREQIIKRCLEREKYPILIDEEEGQANEEETSRKKRGTNKSKSKLRGPDIFHICGGNQATASSLSEVNCIPKGISGSLPQPQPLDSKNGDSDDNCKTSGIIEPTQTQQQQQKPLLPQTPAKIQYENEIVLRPLPLPSETGNASSEKRKRTTRTIIKTRILNLQGSLRDLSKKGKDEAIKDAQELILASKLKMQSNYEGDPILIIGVDATPNFQAGYCVNLKDKKIHYYIVNKDDLPHPLELLEGNKSCEFEMKNLIFALLLWKDLILKHKVFQMYTDNMAITFEQRSSKNYGVKAFGLVSHFVNCLNVKLQNWGSMHVNKYENLGKFATLIRPADDLSRWRIEEAVNFLTDFYEIEKENVEGTHVKRNHCFRANSEIYKFLSYAPTNVYLEVLQTVEDNIRKHKCYKSSSFCNDFLEVD